MAATVAICGVGRFLWRAESRRRADRYHVAADRFAEYANIYRTRDIWDYTTCYGSRWDQFTVRVAKDTEAHKGDLPYLQKKASHYARLSRTYERAAAHPWGSLSADPPAAP
jgi:hypothetical protein